MASDPTGPVLAVTDEYGDLVFPMARIRMAINDPSRFTGRVQLGDDEYESMAVWCTRAIVQILRAWLAGRTVVELPVDTDREALMRVLDEFMDGPDMADWERQDRRRKAEYQADRLLAAESSEAP